MSNNINLNNNVNRYNGNTKNINNTNSGSNTNVSNNGTGVTNANALQKSSTDNLLDTLGLGGMGLDGLLGGQGTEGAGGLAQMLQMGMFSKMFGGGEGSDSGGFQMVLGALVKALNEKQQANRIGIDSNTKYDGVHINEMTLRSLGKAQDINATYSNKTEGERIEAAISSASKKHGIDEGLIRAIIKVESDFNPRTKSSAGAMGLMQLMPENVQHYGVKDPYNIEENIDAGTRHIKDYLKLHNNKLDMALAAYNFGPGNMSRRGIRSEADFYKLPTETKNYLIKIRKYYNP
ncbi:hypothetical protein J2Z44_001020 [Clostridium punense]|uniref:Transglycosylase SLT domain-containing protein n=1 Tax=Clostridium punense TaxID=1054297 RepID=A0ABS4K3K4_9CLOT|nr:MULTISPECIES: lytic transglycosylase domain-containing protein [Clostridium]EQB86435.1 hypothetical protein M918_14305 [Clostridium sp. BL8]MBP2021229.1 hypothetical protein [Clostridium punense]